VDIADAAMGCELLAEHRPVVIPTRARHHHHCEPAVHHAALDLRDRDGAEREVIEQEHT